MKNFSESPTAGQEKIEMPEFPIGRESAYKLLILPDTDAAHVIKAISSYFLFGAEPETAFDGIAGNAYREMREGIDKSGANYRKIVERNRKNGGKGGRPKRPQSAGKSAAEAQESFELPGESKSDDAMLFNFKTFAGIVRRVYPPDSKYTLQDALSVFRAYFQRYEQQTGRAHPNIRAEQIKAIIGKMPFIEGNGFQNTRAAIKPDEYPALIEKHFQTKYRNCDYNINHFFSGRIRELRYYEDTWRKSGKNESL